MSGNPARELRAIFNKWQQSSSTADVTRSLHTDDGLRDTVEALRLLESISGRLDLIEKQGHKVDVFRSTIDDWLRDIFHYPKSWAADAQTTSHDNMLEALEVLLNTTAPTLNPTDEATLAQTVEESLDDTLQALKDDEELDPFLRIYLFEAINHARTCLGRYETSGLFDLARAVKDLEVLLAAAQTMSRDRAPFWKKLRERFHAFTTNPTTAAIAGALASSGATTYITQG